MQNTGFSELSIFILFFLHDAQQLKLLLSCPNLPEHKIEMKNCKPEYSTGSMTRSGNNLFNINTVPSNFGFLNRCLMAAYHEDWEQQASEGWSQIWVQREGCLL